MKRGDTIPIDLVIEILSRLPAKSIARCRCVSKLWCSTLLSPYFTELFRSRSSARPPNLLFAVERFDDWCFLTCPHPQNLDDKPWSLAADFHMKFPSEFCGHRRRLKFCGQASGCILFSRCIRYSEQVDDTLGICKPSTGQYASLPLPLSNRRNGWKSFLGFDPIDKQFKILYLRFKSYYDEANEILILGTSDDSLWRKIDCPFKYSPIRGEGICIDGVLYYGAETDNEWHSYIIVCFDVRYEKFEFIHAGFLRCSLSKLINYNGKLGVITLYYDNYNHDSRRGTWRSLYLEMYLEMWVKDVEEPRHKWSQYFKFRWEDKVVEDGKFSLVGVTATSEIVLATKDASKPFYVFYINTERNTVQSVEIQGLLQANRFDKRGKAESNKVKVFVDHAEDLKFITMNIGATYLSPPEVKRKPRSKSTTSKANLQQDDRPRFESINKFDSLSLLDGDDECT